SATYIRPIRRHAAERSPAHERNRSIAAFTSGSFFAYSANSSSSRTGSFTRSSEWSCCSRDAMRPEKAASSNASRSASLEAVETQPDGSRIAPALGGIHESKRGDDRAHAHRRGALVDRRGCRQKEGAPQLHSSLAFAHPTRRSTPSARDAPRARAQFRLSARTDSERALRAVSLLIQGYVFVLSFSGYLIQRRESE